GGTAFRPSYSSNSTPGGRSSAAASSSFVFQESCLRLPEIARTCIGLRLLDEEELGRDADVVREGRLAARQRDVPVQGGLRAVARRGQLEAEALAAVRIGDRRGDRALEFHRLRDALDRERSGDLELPTVGV